MPRTRKRRAAPARRRAPARKRSRRPTAPELPAYPPELPYNVLVQDIMTRDVAAVAPDRPLSDVLVMMRSRSISGVPVVNEKGILEGVLSEKDIARSLGLRTDRADIKGALDILTIGLTAHPETILRAFKITLERTTVREAMTTPPVCVEPSDTVEKAAELMRDRRVNRLPVVEDGRVVGIVTRHDLISSLLRMVPRPV